MTEPRKTLTITYYVDPRDLKSVTVSIRSARIFVGTFAAVLVWSFTSFAYIATLHLPVAPVAVVPPTDTPATDVAPAAVLDEPAVQDSQVTALKLSAKEKLVAEAPPPPVALSNTTFKEENGQLVFSFALENKSEGQVSGHVWAFARFAPADGASEKDAILLTSHPLLDKTAPESEANLAYAVTYKARMRSLKELRFALPQGTPGRVVDVTVYLQEKSTPAAATFTVPLP